jgi:hypothetical protein
LPAPALSIEDIEEAMAEVAIERNIKDVGQLPLSEQVELQLDKKLFNQSDATR